MNDVLNGGDDVMTTPFGTESAGRRVDLDELRRKVRAQVAMAGDRAFASPPLGDRRPPRVVTEVEREGVPSTDTEATAPLGVGPSMTGRAEKIAQREQEPGLEKGGTEGPAKRPYGRSGPERHTGVGVQGTVHEDSPTMLAGDQGG
ncbi:hypothetical protein Ssi03_24090 [Sphaerisporangium siamense]|nr:hypothetical protein Ssi03_24090 [Sphaerisporangium siamense]